MSIVELFSTIRKNPKKKIIWRKHAFQKMLERGISRKEVLQTIETGKIIKEYLTDKPFPSFLIFNMLINRPLHAVISFDKDNLVFYVITAYIPDIKHFEKDFITKKRSLK